jgi:hypothetical protein
VWKNFSFELDEYEIVNKKVVLCETCDTSDAYSGNAINFIVPILKCLPLVSKKSVITAASYILPQKSCEMYPNSAKAKGKTS